MAIPFTVEFRALFTDMEGERTPTTAYKHYTDETIKTVGDVHTDLAAWCALVAALSNLQLTECTFTYRIYESFALPSPGQQFDDSEDKAYLEFQTAVNGQKYTTQLPGPVDTMFLSDDETVNTADAGVDALITAISASLSTKYGTGSLVYIKGYRRRAKLRKRQRGGIFTEIGG